MISRYVVTSKQHWTHITIQCPRGRWKWPPSGEAWKFQNMKLSHIVVVLLCYISDRMFNSLISINCICFFYVFVSNVVNTSDIMLNYLKSTNCFDELLLHLIVMSWLQFIRRISNALNSTTALTSFSFVNEHFFVKNNDNGNFHYNQTVSVTEANYTQEKNIRSHCNVHKKLSYRRETALQPV